MWFHIAAAVVVGVGAAVAGVVYKLKKQDAEMVAALEKSYERGKAAEAAKEAVTTEEVTIRT